MIISVINFLKSLTHFATIPALIISTITCWYKYLRPAKISANISTLCYKKFSSFRNEKITDQGLLINFSLENIGTRPAQVESIRIKFIVNHNFFFAYPRKKMCNKLTQNIKAPENLWHVNGGPFCDFTLRKDEKWENDYIFLLEGNEYCQLAGKVTFEIESKLKDEVWKKVDNKEYIFTMAVSKDYFKNMSGNCGSEMVFLYSNDPCK